MKSFLCGVIVGSNRPGTIKTRDAEIHVRPNDPGLTRIVVGRNLLVVVSDGEILAVYDCPRIKLMRMIETGRTVTNEILERYQPMYLIKR
jgi:hypothetical protein